MRDAVYLDHNATTGPLPEVVDAMLPYLRERWGNPSSAHGRGVTAKEGVERARAQVAVLLGCNAREVIFTSGGTEASNLALRGVAEALPSRRAFVSTVIEHPATLGPLRWLEAHGHRVTLVGISPDGAIRPEAVAMALDGDTALVSVMHANNETGVMQPVAEIAALAHGKGAFVHVDAAQSVGKVPVHVDALGADLLSVAGHKLYAPKGVGALYVRDGTPLAPFARGAGHERGMRPGTENVASIVGFGVACEMAACSLDATAARARALRDLLLARLRVDVPALVVHGERVARLPNTLHVRFPGVSGAALLARVPDVEASTGSACHAGVEHPSAVLLAMGVARDEALGAVRLTTGRHCDEADVLHAATRLVDAWRALRGT